jgi:predicted NAD-dependent protein-ADP-ribosyltransferase YbiA (DUF1768 family)
MGGPGNCDGTEYSEFDNFYKCSFIVDGLEYCSSETFFQCQKTTNDEDRENIRGCGGLSAWVAGGKIKLRSDWESVKVDEMYKANFEKFRQDENLQKVLIGTKGKIKFYNSTDFWCKWNSKILARVRAELRKAEGDSQVVEEISKEMEEYRKSKI